MSVNVASKTDHAMALNNIREHLENHLKQKLKQSNRCASRSLLYQGNLSQCTKFVVCKHIYAYFVKTYLSVAWSVIKVGKCVFLI